MPHQPKVRDEWGQSICRFINSKANNRRNTEGRSLHTLTRWELTDLGTFEVKETRPREYARSNGLLRNLARLSSG